MGNGAITGGSAVAVIAGITVFLVELFWSLGLTPSAAEVAPPLMAQAPPQAQAPPPSSPVATGGLAVALAGLLTAASPIFLRAIAAWAADRRAERLSRERRHDLANKVQLLQLELAEEQAQRQRDRQLINLMWQTVTENRRWMRAAAARLGDQLPLPKDFGYRPFDQPHLPTPDPDRIPGPDDTSDPEIGDGDPDAESRP